MQNHRKLGELLLDRKLITQQQLADAISEQQRHAKPLGEILLERKIISARQLSRTLKWQALLRAAMLVSSFGLAASPCQASEAQRITQQLVGDLGSAAQLRARNDRPQQAGNTEPEWLRNLRAGPTAPIVTLLSGRYAGGVKTSMKGLRYKADWSDSSVKLELRYQF
ncbi:hypothetical protein L1F30_14930 [Simiduia sp. 21SJ11W-1]|uniref:hypothetical protein n=1 Tax=Simiduia sp. 21SJ11W-1 TaxID=2909669 RepID=UPI00209FFC64|nr:hypothetical protein [Simiduia sp. 21SJ11W-1]UTA47441.1 hypothetical protein L1F30_14930 [Simiduia sp. 21SJ11W-1]